MVTSVPQICSRMSVGPLVPQLYIFCAWRDTCSKQRGAKGAKGAKEPQSHKNPWKQPQLHHSISSLSPPSKEWGPYVVCVWRFGEVMCLVCFLHFAACFGGDDVKVRQGCHQASQGVEGVQDVPEQACSHHRADHHNSPQISFFCADRCFLHLSTHKRLYFSSTVSQSQQSTSTLPHVLLWLPLFC